LNARLVALAAALAFAPGCAYVQDRGLDLAQVVDASMGVSEGFEANLRATKALQVGFGGYRGIAWFGLKDGVLDLWQEERTELGIGPLYVHEVFRSEGRRVLDIQHPLFGDPGWRDASFDLSHLTDRGLFDIGLTVNVIFLGVDLAASPAELVDFVAGLTTFDVLEDDVYSPSTRQLEQRLSGENARVRSAAARALHLRFGEDFGYAQYTAPDQMPAWQILAIRRWREYLEGAEIEAEPSVDAVESPAPTAVAPN
jgi:hypothetical protein